MKITVFTPTYNRAYSLPRLYESLKEQTFQDFEWVIVDDGSKDNTTEVIKEFIAKRPFFEINYYKIKNGGKHRAINQGIGRAKGMLFFIVDSDDFLPSNALEWVDIVESSIPCENKSDFAGVCGLKCDLSDNIIGKSFSGEYLDITTLERGKYGISGDRAEVFYTDLLKKYPFPEIDGEKFCTESLVWNLIAHDGYKLRYFNKNIYSCEYLDDGLTYQGWQLYANNPIQWGMYVAQERDFGILTKYNLSIQYYKYYLLLHKKYTISTLSEMLSESEVVFGLYFSFQKVLDRVRKILGKKSIQGECTQCK